MSRQAEVPGALDIDADYKPLRDRVRDELRRRIIDDVYPPGTRLVETELAAGLGVSRLPVREALRALETEGFVRTLPRRGAVVVELTERDVEELFDVRESLEMLASRQAAERATKAELRRVRNILARARKALDAGDHTALGQANEAFHDEILKLSRNNLLQSMLEPLQGRLHRLLRQTGDPHSLLEEHAAWFEAIASGDPELAERHAREHARRNREIVRDLMAKRNQSASPA